MTDLERAIKTPALVWLKRFLGVKAEEDEFGNWLFATGQWAHHWLGCIADGPASFNPLPHADEIRARVRAAALRFRAEIFDLLARLDRPLPEWWISGWRNAAYIAERLADRVAQITNWSHLATEWSLPRASFSLVRQDDSSVVSLSGRIDLLLARHPRGGDLPFAEFSVVDYKTGNRKGLTKNKLIRGDGVQLALYALALRTLGASRADMNILTRALDLDRTQLTLEDIEARPEVWRALARMVQSGVFGMRGELRAEFGFQNDYPLATLAVDHDLLEEKWAATYPALVPPNE